MRTLSNIVGYAVGLLSLFVWLAATAADYKWPRRGTDPYPWAEGGSKQLNERFSQASTNALGTTNDIVAIRKAIASPLAPENVEVREIRWLSPAVVMAYTRIRTAGFYHVVEKKKDKWEILTYYLLWVERCQTDTKPQAG